MGPEIQTLESFESPHRVFCRRIRRIHHFFRSTQNWLRRPELTPSAFRLEVASAFSLVPRDLLRTPSHGLSVNPLS